MMRSRTRLRLYAGLVIMALCFLLLYVQDKSITREDVFVKNQTLEYSLDDYYGENIFLNLETKRILGAMTDEEKVGHLLMPAYESNTEIDRVATWMRDFHVGGLMVLRNDLDPEDTNSILDFYGSLDDDNRLPLFFSIDAEPSLMRYRLPQSDYRITTESLDTGQRSFEAGFQIGIIIDEYGFNLNFAPVYDSNSNRSVISDRSYGDDVEMIAKLAQSFVRGQEELGIMTTAKHFPGHGSVWGDTHLTLQTVSGDLPELDQFKAAIESNTPFMMVGHLAVDQGKYDTDGYPSTLSKKIMFDLLRSELDYKGIVITDAMNMGALEQFRNSKESLALQAIVAGADVVLMPSNIEKDYLQILERMENDPRFKEEINKKVERIIRMKLVWQWTKNSLQVAR